MPYALARRTACLGAGLMLTTAAALAAEGLRVPQADAWPTWQARINLRIDEPADGGWRTLRQAALLGDWYLQRPSDDTARWRGGFRATGGLVVGGLGLSTEGPGAGPAWSASLLTTRDDRAAADRDAWPYIGFGYSGLAPRGGWGFSADLGIALRQPAGAVDLGRAVLGLRGWEDALRRIDALPMLHLGVRYRF